MLLKGFFANNMVLLACALIPMVASAEAEYYTWVDENGVTNYAQKNPQGYDAEHVSKNRPFGHQDTGRPQGNSAETSSTSTETSSTESEAEAEEEDLTSSIANERDAIAKQIAAVKKSNCELGKRNLAQLEAYARIRVEEDGVQRTLNDEEKNDRTNEARQIIQDNCTG